MLITDIDTEPINTSGRKVGISKLTRKGWPGRRHKISPQEFYKTLPIAKFAQYSKNWR